MDPNRLPPLNALRAFDAVARHGSFSKAAQNLRITQGAVSRHVSNLEAHLGCTLFERGKSGAHLTPAGQRYHDHTGPALQAIARGTEALRSDHALSHRLRISAPASFALRWLTPRLPQFENAANAPAPELMISDMAPDFNTSACDIAIVPHPIKTAAAAWQLLFEERLIPVCHPEFWAGKTVTELLNCRLIRTTTRPEIWANWAKAFYPERAEAPREDGPGMQDFYLSIEAALAGDGIALVPAFLVVDSLAAGRLITPVDTSFASGHAYWMVNSPGATDRKSVRAFRKWLVTALKPLQCRQL